MWQAVRLSGCLTLMTNRPGCRSANAEAASIGGFLFVANMTNSASGDRIGTDRNEERVFSTAGHGVR